jgi:streptogramin lyase
MLALYRCGRQAEALETYQTARVALRDELGIQPTPELRNLERAILQHDPALAAPPASVADRVKGRPGLVAAGALAAFVALASVFAFRRGAEAPVKVVANSVAVIDPKTDRVVDDLPVGDYAGALAAGNGSVWVTTAGGNTVTRIDAASRKPSFPNGIQQALDLAVTRSALWIGNGTNYETSPGTGGGMIERVALRDGAARFVRVGPPKTRNEWWTVVSSDGESVWADNPSSRTLVQLDADTGDIVRRVHGVGGGRIAVGDDAVWVAEYARNSVARIDRRTGSVTRIPVSSHPTTIAVGEGSVWVTTQKPHSAVWRIDPQTREPTDVIPVPATARSVATGSGAVWVTSGTYVGQPGVPPGPGRVTKIDPRTDRSVETIVFGYRPDGVTVYDGLVWVAVAPRR